MERKIGEIFEFDGEWYQCVEGRCKDCHFSEKRYLCKQFIGKNFCLSGIIFKKLEKVGEPFTIVGTLCQHYKVFDIDNVCGDGFWCVHDYKAKTLTIEIKQTNEDMEEKKLKIGFEKADYLINKLQEILADYLHGGESDEVIAKFEELLDIEEKHSNSERIEKNLREFDLEKAKAGKSVCTRDGRKARIICFDKRGEQPIVALIEKNEEESIDTFFSNGHSVSKTNEVAGDLMMLAEKRSGWAKVRKDINLYDTKEEADRKMIGNDEYVTAKVEWEE